MNSIFYLYSFIIPNNTTSSDLSNFNSLKKKLKQTQNKLDKYYETKQSTVKYTKCVYSFNPFKKHKFSVAKFLNVTNIDLSWVKLYEILIQFELVIENVSYYSDNYEPLDYLANKQNINIHHNDTNPDVYIYNYGIKTYDSTDQELDYHDEFVLKVQDMKSKLNVGGVFVIKCYTILNPKTIAILCDLTLSFGKILIYKPYSSNPANSEIYLVCVNYSENNVSFPKEGDISPSLIWLKNLYNIQTQLVDYQIKNINLEISGYEKYKNLNRSIPFNYGNGRNKKLVGQFNDLIGL